MSKKGKKVALVIFLIIMFTIIAFFGLTAYNLSPLDPSDETNIVLEIKEGTGKAEIANQLKKAKLIKSSFFLKVYLSFSSPTLYAGTYKLSPSMSALEILDKLKMQDNLENEIVTVTFIEGKRLSTYVKQISENFNYSEEEIYNKINDPEFLNTLINKYWFITKDILADGIYYPLEGYIYPDTYDFKKTSTVEEIVMKTLDNMDKKLSQYKEEINLSSYSIHQLLTLASIVELEGANSLDRAGIAGVFYNRLKDNLTLGSDVTTYYAVKKDFSTDLTWVDLNSCNGYNTRGTCVKGLPIGPIDSASLESIVAVLEPKTHDYYFFVSDTNKQTYFSKTATEHAEIVNKLKSEGIWFEY